MRCRPNPQNPPTGLRTLPNAAHEATIRIVATILIWIVYPIRSVSTAEEATIRISELSRRSGVPVPTIKFYIREGILSRGESTAPNQARYSEEHLNRLALIGALQQAG